MPEDDASTTAVLADARQKWGRLLNRDQGLHQQRYRENLRRSQVSALTLCPPVARCC
tara:strand:+ start:226 stop:396 length:171 start_codon:yes stop_codon:yes gene_type:complete